MVCFFNAVSLCIVTRSLLERREAVMMAVRRGGRPRVMLYPVVSSVRSHVVPSGSNKGLNTIRSASSPTPQVYLSFSKEVGGAGSVSIDTSSSRGRSGPQIGLSPCCFIAPAGVFGLGLLGSLLARFRLLHKLAMLFVPCSVWMRTIWEKSSHSPYSEDT